MKAVFQLIAAAALAAAAPVSTLGDHPPNVNTAPACQCFANEDQYEAECEGSPGGTVPGVAGITDPATCAMNHHCHWGPEEIPACANMAPHPPNQEPPPPCAVTCPHPPNDCAEAMAMGGPGGCAETCGPEVRNHFADLLGCRGGGTVPMTHPPGGTVPAPEHCQCFANDDQFANECESGNLTPPTCQANPNCHWGPEEIPACANMVPHTATNTHWLGAAGGGQNGPPPCARTCTHPPQSCAEAMMMGGPGGCAESCPPEMKAHYADMLGCHGGGTVPEPQHCQCFANEDQYEDECEGGGTVPGFVDPMSCAANPHCHWGPEEIAACANMVPAMPETAVGGVMPMPGGQGPMPGPMPGGHQGPPPCAVTCPHPPHTCAEAMAMGGPMGCAHSCPQSMKDHFADLLGCRGGGTVPMPPGTGGGPMPPGTGGGPGGAPEHCQCFANEDQYEDECEGGGTVPGMVDPAMCDANPHCHWGPVEIPACANMVPPEPATALMPGGRGPPPCARTCQHPPHDCQEAMQMGGPGGCAHSCPESIKSHYADLLGCHGGGTVPMPPGTHPHPPHPDGSQCGC